MASDADDGNNVLLANSGKIVAVLICAFAALTAFSNIAERLGASPATVLTTILITTTAAIGLTGWPARSSLPSEFFTARGKLPPFINALAGLAGWLAVPAFAALAGLLYTFGFDGLAFVAGPMAGLFLAGVLISPYLAASGSATVSGFLGRRYGATVRVISALVIASVSFVVFAAALQAAAGLAARVLDIPLPLALAATLVLIAVSALTGGASSLTWTGAATALLFLMVLCIASVGMSLSGFGQPLPSLASAQALQTVSDLEIAMIEKGMADAAAMKPHAKPFLQMNPANVFGLIFSLMIATAALPHLLHRSLTLPSAQVARSSSAWLMGLTLIVLVTASAWAIFAKHEVYSIVERGTAFAALPDWMGKVGDGEGVRIYGVSVRLVEDVTAVVQAGAQTSTQVADALQDRNAGAVATWAGLKEPVKAAIIEAAKTVPADGVSQIAWTAMRERILPAAAVAAGNKTGALNLASLKIDAGLLMQDLPQVFRQQATVLGLVLASAFLGSLAMAGAGLFNAAAVLCRDLVRATEKEDVTKRQVMGARVVMLVLGLFGAAGTLVHGINWGNVLILALPAAGATLLPALIFAIWWKRANVLGAALAMVTGLAVVLVYSLGTLYFPVQLFDVWPAASDALPAALKKFATLKAALATAQGDQATNIAGALDALARGTPYAPGVANWWGLGAASALVFAIPAGVVALLIGSLLGPRPTQTQSEFIALIWQPRDINGSASTVP